MTATLHAVTDDGHLSELDYLLGEFRADLEQAGRSPRTIRNYVDIITGFGTWLEQQGMTPTLDNITKNTCREWMAYLKDTGQKTGTRGLKFASLRRFCRYLVDEGHLGADPTARLTQPTAETPPPPVLEEAELAALLKTCEGSNWFAIRDMALFRLMINTGIRVAEAAGLRLTDVDMEARIIYVTGKGSRLRAVAFDAKTAKFLYRYLRVRGKYALGIGDVLFVGDRGPLHADAIGKRLAARSAEAGIKHVHPHMLRHTRAHQLKSAGMSDENTMKLMGWRNHDVMRRYGSALAERRALDASQALGLGNSY
jgi:site-specific recombinase XerD